MTLHLKSRGYPFRPRLLFSCFIVVGVGFPNCVLFQERTNFYFTLPIKWSISSELFGKFLGRICHLKASPVSFSRFHSASLGKSSETTVSDCEF